MLNNLSNEQLNLAGLENFEKPSLKLFWFKHKRRLTAFFILELIAILLTALIFFIYKNNVAAISQNVVIFVVLIFVLPALLLIKLIDLGSNNGFMAEFARLNNLNYLAKINAKGEIGVIFSRGYYTQAFNEIKGMFLEYPFRLFNYSYKPDSKNTSNYTVMDLEFESKLPRMYLDAHKNASFLTGGLQILPLESNEFNKVFNLYITPNQQLSALQIFSPDVLNCLLDLPDKLDLELIDNQIYIYEFGLVKTRAQLKAIFKLLSVIVENIKGEIERMKRINN